MRKLSHALQHLYDKCIYHWALRNNHRFTKYLRSKGIAIGDGCTFQEGVCIDTTRPSLVTIGNNVRMNKNFTLLTHDFGTSVFRLKYYEFIPSSGKVNIGNNVYFAQKCTVLKGVTIGDNCIIGYGSIVTKSIPSNTVAVGCPARVLCTLDEYFDKRKSRCLEEAFEYARSIVDRYHRRPTINDFWEEFPLFVDGKDADKYPGIPIRSQLDIGFEKWSSNHQAPYKNFEDFLLAAGL